jgi:hypothetical protein
LRPPVAAGPLACCRRCCQLNRSTSFRCLPACLPHHCRPDALASTAKTNESIGSVFKKGKYRQYTDATFTKLVRAVLPCTALSLHQ